MMEFRNLQTFQAIIREGSFIEAAKKLQYAQSTITLHIQKLEEELGVKLFSRRGKRIELTVAGRTLQKHADLLLYRAVKLQQAMTDLVAGKAGELRIGSVEPVASVHLPIVLVEFCRQYPQVRLTLEVGVTQRISQGVAAGKLDLAICSPPAAGLGLQFKPLFQDPISILIPKNHHLASEDSLTASLLAGERLILTEEQCPYRDTLEKALIPYNINPFSGIEIMSLETLKQMVYHGLGIGVLPTAAITPPPPNTVKRNILDLDLKLSIGMIINPEVNIPGSALDSLAISLNNSLRNLQ